MLLVKHGPTRQGGVILLPGVCFADAQWSKRKKYGPSPNLIHSRR